MDNILVKIQKLTKNRDQMGFKEKVNEILEEFMELIEENEENEENEDEQNVIKIY